VPELMPGSVVRRLRSLSRTTVLVVCTALLAFVISVLRPLDAPTWTQIVGAVFVLALALASEADKRRTARLEKERNEQAALEAAEEKDRKWLREARSALRIWPAPEIADADPELLGITLRLGRCHVRPMARRLPGTCKEISTASRRSSA
jgi:hypothetical protein